MAKDKEKDWDQDDWDEKWDKKWRHKKWHHRRRGPGAGGFVFFAAFIGVAVYYVQQVHGFWPIILAILKAIVWPAFLLYHVFSMLHM
jgi:hypothetical protein